MENISVFEMLKIGIGPSSSHTLGPWRAAERFLKELKATDLLSRVKKIQIHLYGSLSLTGKGHATDLALLLGLSGTDPEYIPIKDIAPIVSGIKSEKILFLAGIYPIAFFFEEDIIFHREFLPFHANGLCFKAELIDGNTITSTFYSIGGGFISKGEDENIQTDYSQVFPFPFNNGKELLELCRMTNLSITEIMYQNEKSVRSEALIHTELMRIWQTMLESMYIGCHEEGELPGGLHVRRRAYEIHSKLKGEISYHNPQEWMNAIRKTKIKFRQIFKWVSCFALAVNEVNASLGRVVTAPTNGSAGVIPAVLMYYLVIENHEAGEKEIKQFLMVAGVIGSIFKKGSTISAAMGGCQAEIGVSSAMAAAALCELLGGSPEQVTIAAEIAMEHHLGLTCDPIGGLVQIPCIERNAMGAIKAINAAELALDTDPKDVKVSLDKVVHTMWETAKDMHHKYKETSEGGLAVTVNVADC